MTRLLLLSLVCLSMTACVQRTLSINSEPEGAIVYLNDEEVGRTPLSVPFTFYGTYDVRLVKDGYQTLNTERKATPPPHDSLGMDLLNEAAPWRVNVRLDWLFELEELQPVSESAIVDRGRQLRALLNEEAAAATDSE